MKTILLWDPRFPDRRPARLTVEDSVASAAVRAGVAAAANPAEAGALSAGGALDPGMLTEVALQHGSGSAIRRVFIPYSVALVGAAAGVLAAVGTPIAGGVVLPTITLTGPLSYSTTSPSGTLVANIGNVPAGVTPTLTPNDGRLLVAGGAGAWTVVTGLSASTAGTITLAVAATGATGASASIAVMAPNAMPLLNDWRAPVSAAYDSNNVAADISALAAGSTAKTLPEIIVLGNATRTIAFDVGAITAPGGMLYFSTKYSGAWTITVDQSTDSGATWTGLGFTPQAPNTATGAGTMGKYNDRGQWVLLAAGAARRVRIVATTSDGTALSIFPGVFQFRADGVQPFVGVVGCSIQQLSVTPIETRDYIRSLYPNSDPILIDWGLFGNKYAEVNSRSIQPLLALNLPFGFYLFGGNPNDFLAGNRPYSAATLASRNQMRADIDAGLALLAPLGKPVFAGTATFSDYNGNPVGVDTNGSNNPEKGAQPFNEFIIQPAIAASAPFAATSIAASIGAPVFDEYQRSLLRYETGLKRDDHIHDSQTGNITNQEVWAPAWRLMAGEARGDSWLEQRVARCNGSASPWLKNRLQVLYGQLPATADSTQQSNRASLLATINGLSTTYADPAGVTLPSALPGGPPVAWFDPAKWDTVTTTLSQINAASSTTALTGTTNSTATISAFPQPLDVPIGAGISGVGIAAGTTVIGRDPVAKTLTLSAPATASATGVALTITGSGGSIVAITDRLDGVSKLEQATFTSQPAYRDHAVNRRGTISSVLLTHLAASSGPILSALTAAGQPFTLGFKMFTNPFGTPGDVMGWNNGGTILGIVGPSGGTGYGSGLAGLRFFGDGAGRATETARYEAWKPYWIVIVYDGTTVTVYRNGVQTASGAWAKAAWAPTVFRYGCRGAGTNFTQHDLGDLVLLNRAVAGSELATLNAYRSSWAIT